jgi:hypothetical protein
MQVTDIHEPDLPWWDWTPAEILVQSRVFSPLLEAEGVGPVSIRHRDGINAPLYDWNAEGDTQVLGQIVFDDFLREDETELRIDLWAEELDWLLEYEVTETIGIGSEIDAMGTGTVTVPVTGAGTYAFNAGDWNCDLTVEVFTYPFPPLVTGTSAEAVAVAAPGLAIHPNPFRESVMIRTPAGSDPASMLTIHDVSGRLVHRVRLRESVHTWDGRDAAGRAVPAGVYFLRAQSEAGEATGRCLRVR